MTINEHISDFLRDAQYRLAEITNELKLNVIDEDSFEYKQLNSHRKELWLFMRVIFYGSIPIYQSEKSGFLNDWTDSEILEEIEYLRDKVGISEIPWVSYTGYQPLLINSIRGEGITEEVDPTIVKGTEGQIPEYGENGQTLIPKNKPTSIGWTVADISEYFNRTTSFGYLLHAIYTESEWTSENPILLAGEIGFVEENGVCIKYKVGPGRWNDLSYQEDVYSHNDAVTNPIGDASSNLENMKIGDILKLMLSPYKAPVISNFKNDASGTSELESIIELGNSISGSVDLSFDITYEANLSGATPLNVTAGSTFSNEGDFANGQISLSLASALQPTTLTNIEIKIKSTHTNGETLPVSTFIRFQPKIIWGVSSKTSLTASEIANISSKKTKISSSYKHEYLFEQSGYLYLAIPSTLDPNDLSFADVTDKQIPLPIDMEDLGVVTSVNNGVGTYNYQVFRTKYSMTVNETKISVL